MTFKKFFLYSYIKNFVIFAEKFLLRSTVRFLSGKYFYNNIHAYNKIFLYFANENQSYINSKNLLPVSIYEFGCGSGSTGVELIKAANFNKVPINKYWGYDSFQGLPEVSFEEKKRWTQGSFKYSEKETVLKFKKITSKKTDIKIFSSSFKDLEELEVREKTPWLIHIDCDLYNSTIESLRICRKLLKNGGGIICFDDYYSGLLENIPGEKSAFDEYCHNEKIKFVFWGRYSQNGALFIIPRSQSN